MAEAAGDPVAMMQQLQTELRDLQALLTAQNQTIANQQNQIANIPPPAPRIKPDCPSPFSGKKSEPLET
jgi:hypothetical protein